MKFIWLFIIIILTVNSKTTLGQTFAISRNGSYAVSFDNLKQCWSVESTSNNWKLEIPGLGPNTRFFFTFDSKKILFLHQDTLFIRTLNSEKRTFLTSIDKFSLSASKNEVLTYKHKGNDALFIYNLVSERSRKLNNVKSYEFDPYGEILIYQTKTVVSEIHVFNLKTSVDTKIWIAGDKDCIVKYFTFSKIKGEFAFMTKSAEIDGGNENAIWHFSLRLKNAVKVVDNKKINQKNLVIADQPFSYVKNGNLILFKIEDTEISKSDFTKPKVNVWSYTDATLQSGQLKHVEKKLQYWSAVSILSGIVSRIENDNEKIMAKGTPGSEPKFQFCDAYAVVGKFDFPVFGVMGSNWNLEYNWNRKLDFTLLLVDLQSGEKTSLGGKRPFYSESNPYYTFSPKGRILVYFDELQNQYFKYDLDSKNKKCLTEGLNINWKVGENGDSNNRRFNLPRGILGWLSNESGVIVWDGARNLWKFNFYDGSRVKLTNSNFEDQGYNFYSSSTSFENQFPLEENIFSEKDYIILKGGIKPFKMQSLYKVEIGYPANFRQLSNKKTEEFAELRKSDSCNSFLVWKRLSGELTQRIYFTKDFINYKELSGNNIEANSILGKRDFVVWRDFKGKKISGYLYKPYDFDSTKRYPMIVNYYEKIMNAGPPLPYYSEKPSPFSIGYCLSRGYLYFQPDIFYSVGSTGDGVVNSVVSGVKSLFNRPYIDSKRVGIAGFSFGGFETNFLITHTDIFAAAFSAAGMSDAISSYLSDGHYSGVGSMEMGQQRLGVSLWQRPDLYLKNSPVFYADRISTPLLLYAGTRDPVIPWTQSLEMFIALRRLGKRVWLLQYDDGSHYLPDDAAIRAMQFFDHYLRGVHPPKWMSEGITARKKQIELGLDLDTSCVTPGKGILRDSLILTPQQKKILTNKTNLDSNGKIIKLKIN